MDGAERSALRTKLWGEYDVDRMEMRDHGVFGLVEVEMHRQDEKWGMQRHPLVGSANPDLQRAQYAQAAEDWKARNDVRVSEAWIGWDGVLLEEVYEALECDTVDSAVTELTQVMAVCAQMILNLRERGSL